MKISAKIDYACRALLELSLHWPNPEPLQVEQIAQRQQVPVKFLTQILIHLKQIGYVESVRGKNGGYLLRKSPREIKLNDMMENFQDANNSRDEKSSPIFSPIWREVNQEFLKAMDKFNFEDISNRKREVDSTPTFQI
ncbi:MAG: Rrf2 family transcriptional regulator [Candidatus Omnitrophica bacterium]|nr:Rrf2 family transcriptional regulator [Candidatus Omnitrophota bacterium]